MSDEYGIRRHPDYRERGREELARGDVASLSRATVRLPNGQDSTQDVIELPPAVTVVPIDRDERGEEVVVLIEQFRVAVEGYMHELPAGRVDPGESAEHAAARELEEETGYRARRLERLATLLMIPGTSAHRLSWWLAEGLEPGELALEPEECIRVRRVPLRPLVARLVNDPPGSTPIVDAKTHLGLLHVAALLDSRRGGESS